MANPNWVKGAKSPNPQGRAKMKSSARTVKGMVERFIKRNITPNKLQAMFDKLGARDKLSMLTLLLPYCTPKQSQLSINAQFDQLSDRDLERLYNQVMGAIPQPEPIQLVDGNTLIPANFNRYGQE